MNRNHTKLFLASLAAGAALSAGAANATDHRMWRDQVARPVDSVIELESRLVDPKKNIGNDSLLWREQIEVARNHRVFILESAPQRASKSSDTRLWREQIQSDPSESTLRTAKNQGE